MFELLSRYDIKRAAVRLVSRLDCDIYRVRPTEVAAGTQLLPPGDLALRVYPEEKHDLSAIEAELDWLLALDDDGVLVPRPLTDRQGRVVQAWYDRPAVAARHAVLLTWLPGRMHDKGLSPLRLERIGELAARLHLRAESLAKAGRIKSRRSAFSADLDGWARGSRAAPAYVSPALRRRVAETAECLTAELAGFSTAPHSHGFVHADLHPWNIVFAGRVAGAIDFSDCGWGHHALDLATTLQYLKHPLAGNHDHRASYPQFHDRLLSGYARVRPLPPAVERQIEVYIVARMIATLEWIVGDWPRPDHRAWGPGFLRECGAVMQSYLRGS